MTTISTHQPVYLPSAMLFNKIALSDMFLFLSHVQFEPRSWQQRNCIRNGDEAIFLTVPVCKKGHRFQPINEVGITIDSDWRAKHLKSIQHSYSGRPFFRQYFPQLEALLMRDWRLLCDLNIALIKQILDWLEIRTPLLDSRDYALDGKGNEMLISLCKALGADHYVSNIGSAAYIDEAMFARAGIAHQWQKFEFPVYQQGAAFLDRLSVIDLLFNLGPASHDVVLQAGTIVDRLENVQGNT